MTDPSEPAEGDRATAGGDRSSEDLPAETDAPREPGVRDVLDLARRALDEGIVPLVLPWVGFLVVKLAILGPLTVGLVANMNLDADLQSHLQPPVTLEDYRQILPFPLEITVAALLVIPLLLHLELIYKSGLFRNLRELADRGPDAFDGAAEALARPLDDFGHLLAASVVWSLIVGLGTLFCVLPGLAAGFALSPYMYIVATRDTNLTDPLWTSIDWVKRHWGILLVVFALGFVLLSVVSGFTQVVGALAIPLAVGSGAGAGSLGLAAGLLSVLSMPIQAVGMFGAWLLLGAALVVIDDWESDARTGTW